MPRVTSYTPAWLCRPSPGFQLFNSAPQSKSARSSSPGSQHGFAEYIGPTRTIARRGSEVFVVVGKQIRWADLASLKDQWQAIQETPSKKPKGKGKAGDENGERSPSAPEDGSYRVLKASISEPIRQLCISPNENLMAIATTHTVHIAILPPPDLLNAQHNQEPLKLKIYTIGPTTHVLSQSPVPSVLWHPLGVDGNCLVTITADAIVRLWEFDLDNRWSADSPALALDLKKLVVARSNEDDVKPYRAKRNTTYSADAVGMDVASACFGGAGYGDEAPWSAMTLWVAMTSGDIYALCPLLPSRFQPPTDLLPSLLPAVMEKQASLTEGDQRVVQVEDQIQWANDLDNQEPIIEGDDSDSGLPIEIYKRPSGGNSTPALQGPFQLFPEDAENDLELSDIYVIAAKSNNAEGSEESESGSEMSSDNKDEEGLSSTLVCLMTREGRVYICMDLEGVDGKWLPSRPPEHPSTVNEDPILVVLESLETLKPGEDCPIEWPTFTQDTGLRYSFFTTHSRGVYFFSCSPWLENLDRELQNDDSSGVEFRLKMLQSNITTTRERILTFPPPDESNDTDIPVTACVIIEDSDLGYFLLTSHDSHPQTATLDRPYLPPLPHGANNREPTPMDNDDPTLSIDSLAPSIAYPPYQPSPAFYTASTLPNFPTTHVQARHRHLLKSEIRLSTATLDIMTEAHRVLSRETHQLGVAAADLFRRCDSLLEVLRNQVVRAGGVAERVDAVTIARKDGEGEEGRTTKDVLEERIERARERQGNLKERVEVVRRRVRGLENRELSVREEEWVREVDGVAGTVLGRRKEDVDESEGDRGKKDGDGDGDEVDEREMDEEAAEHLSRFKEVQRLAASFLQEAKDLTSSSSSPPDQNTNVSPSRQDTGDENVPSSLRKRKLMDVKKMLDKETQLVNQTQARLEQLTLAATVS